MLFKYILKRLLGSFLSISSVVIGLLWLTQSFRFMEIIVNHNISLLDYFKLVIFLIPDLVALLSPSCLILSGIWSYYKLIVDHEWVVMQALGVSVNRLSLPLVSLGTLVFFMTLSLNIYLVPWSFQKFRDFEHHMRHYLSRVVLKEGAFYSVKGITIYVDEKKDDYSYKTVFIDAPSKNKEPVTLIAEEGRYDADQNLFFLLNGQRQDKNEQKELQIFSFKHLLYDLSPFFSTSEQRMLKPYEKSLKDLFTPSPKLEPSQKRKFQAEGHQRILLPFLVLIDILAVIHFFLTSTYTRRKFQRRKFIFFLCGIFCFNLLLHLEIGLWVRYGFSIYCLYASVLLPSFALICARFKNHFLPKFCL